MAAREDWERRRIPQEAGFPGNQDRSGLSEDVGDRHFKAPSSKFDSALK